MSELFHALYLDDDGNPSIAGKETAPKKMIGYIRVRSFEGKLQLKVFNRKDGKTYIDYKTGKAMPRIRH